MNFIPLLFYSIAFFLLLVYAVMIWRTTKALKKNKQHKKVKNESGRIRIDVIIPYHNEENYLPLIAADLAKQSHQNFRVIWVNDHSTDNSTTKLKEVYNKDDTVFLDAKNSGKKHTVAEALSITNAELIVFTDADCRLPETWLSGYASLHCQQKKGLYFGAVINSTSNNLQKLFALEFLSLMGTGMGLGLRGSPVYMNGANYAISADLKELSSQQDGQKYSSGDDVFLLHTVKKLLGSKYIIPYPSDELVVTTPAPKSVKSFIRQRIRWGGKAKSYKDVQTFLLAVRIFTIAFVQIFVLFYWPVLLLSILIWVFKMGTDYFALWQYTGKWKKHELRQYIFLTSLLYPFYIIITAFSGLLAAPQKWYK